MAKRNEKAKKLTLGEKLRLMSGDGGWTIPGVPRVGIEPVRVADGPSGLRYVPNGSMDFGMDGPAHQSIAYPCPALIACSFDTALLEEYGKTLAAEFKASGVDVILGPGINIKRNPLCGRNFEYYSEDPYLSGMLAASFTDGCQSQGVGACLKHFACNSQESYRMVNNSLLDERTLHEIYLRAFQIAIEKCSPWMVMASYNKINGTYACESKDLLLGTLKGKWHYTGVVVSDWGAVNDPILSHENGLDVEMPCFINRQSQLFLAAERKMTGRGKGEEEEDAPFVWGNQKVGRKLSRKRIDDIANRVTRLSERVQKGRAKTVPFDLKDGKAHAFAVKLAEQSCVLAKNNGILPLKSLKGVGIIGELAEKPRFGGGGSSQVKGYAPKSFLDVCKEILGPDKVEYRPGYLLDQPEEDAPEFGTSDLALDALDLAARCEKVIVFLGTTPAQESEGFDRESMRLPDAQADLFRSIAERNSNAIAVIATGAPVEMAFAEGAAAQLITYFPGEGGGEAIYNLLTGKANPSGHFAETWPARSYEVPSFGFYPGDQPQSLYREALYVGYRYYVTAEDTLGIRYPFGFGLSYTQFEFDSLRVTTKKAVNIREEPLTVKVSVKNATRVAGDALVQIYVHPVGGNVFKPTRTLQAFQKVHLDGNRRVDVELELTASAFEHYDVESKSFLIEGGAYDIEVGTSCIDIVASARVNIVGDDKEFPSQRNELAIYYQPPKDGFWLYDDAFAHLIGKKVPFPKDPRARPFTLNSTIENIRNTWIGKYVIRKAAETIGTTDEKDFRFRTMLEMPIRNVIMSGMSDKIAQAIVDAANGDFISAFWHVLFRKSPRK